MKIKIYNSTDAQQRKDKNVINLQNNSLNNALTVIQENVGKN